MSHQVKKELLKYMVAVCLKLKSEPLGKMVKTLDEKTEWIAPAVTKLTERVGWTKAVPDRVSIMTNGTTKLSTSPRYGLARSSRVSISQLQPHSCFRRSR